MCVCLYWWTSTSQHCSFLVCSASFKLFDYFDIQYLGLFPLLLHLSFFLRLKNKKTKKNYSLFGISFVCWIWNTFLCFLHDVTPLWMYFGVVKSQFSLCRSLWVLSGAVMLFVLLVCLWQTRVALAAAAVQSFWVLPEAVVYCCVKWVWQTWVVAAVQIFLSLRQWCIAVSSGCDVHGWWQQCRSSYLWGSGVLLCQVGVTDVGGGSSADLISEAVVYCCVMCVCDRHGWWQ